MPVILQISLEMVLSLKKRNRAKTKDRQQSDNPKLTGGEVKDDGCVTEKSTAKSAKRVRFSMKNLFLCSSTYHEKLIFVLFHICIHGSTVFFFFEQKFNCYFIDRGDAI